MVLWKDYSRLPEQRAFKIDVQEAPEYDVGTDDLTVFSPIQTDDISIIWSEAEPGASLAWHSHSPDFYQILMTVRGECRYYYKDNEGETRTVETGPQEIFYLPGGAENRREVIGDEPHLQIGALKRTRLGRMEYLLEEEYEGGQATTPKAMVYDNMNDEVVHIDETSVTEIE